MIIRAPGIVMAPNALRATQLPVPNLFFTFFKDGNQNGVVEMNECVELFTVLRNTSPSVETNNIGVITVSTPGL